MKKNRYSRTALFTAIARAHHFLHHESRIIEDPYAESLMSDLERTTSVQALVGALSDSDREKLEDPHDEAAAVDLILRVYPFAAAVLARSRYAEDRFLQAVPTGIHQYVLIGAGLDSFPFRYPHDRGAVDFFEVDFPASQAFKIQRLAAIGLGHPENLHFVPADLEREGLADALGRSPFRFDEPAFFAWLGVTVYLRTETIRETLRAIKDLACPRSQLVFDFLDIQGIQFESTSDRIRRYMALVSQLGEPLLGALDSTTLEPDLRSLGFRLLEQLTPESQRLRYYQNRRDGLEPTEYYHFACAAVLPGTGATTS
jgi:methyltransferase (TIGR00027 family)